MSVFTVSEDEAVAPSRVSGQWAGVARAVPVFWTGDRTGEETGEDFDPRTPKSPSKRHLELEARVGIEPTMQLLQSRALPLGYPAFQGAGE